MLQILGYSLIVIWGLLPWINEYLDEEPDYVYAANESLAFYSACILFIAIGQLDRL